MRFFVDLPGRELHSTVLEVQSTLHSALPLYSTFWTFMFLALPSEQLRSTFRQKVQCALHLHLPSREFNSVQRQEAP